MSCRHFSEDRSNRSLELCCLAQRPATTNRSPLKRLAFRSLPIAHDVTVQRHVAGMSVHLDSARSMLYQSASQWEGADIVTKGILAAKAKYLCAEAALEATSKAIQIVGGRSISKSLPLERAFRDVRACTLMPPNSDAMLANIGKAQLGLAGTTFGLDA